LLVKRFGVPGPPQLRKVDFVAARCLFAGPDEVGRSNLAQLLVKAEIPVGEKRKRDVVGLLKKCDLIIRIPDADADQLDFPLERRVAFNLAINGVYRRSLLLAVRSIHVENFNDNHLGLDFRNLEVFGSGNAEVFPEAGILRGRKRKLRKKIPGGRRRGCLRLPGAGRQAENHQPTCHNSEHQSVRPFAVLRETFSYPSGINQTPMLIPLLIKEGIVKRSFCWLHDHEPLFSRMREPRSQKTFYDDMIKLFRKEVGAAFSQSRRGTR
jgi:hypothetical protein